MKRCSRCEREIPESATTCGKCDDVSMATTAAPPVQAARASSPASVTYSVTGSTHGAIGGSKPTSIPASIEEAVAPLEEVFAALEAPAARGTLAPPIPTAAPAAAAKARRSNRGMIAAALVVVAGGTLTFAMLRSSTPAVPLATHAAKPTPAGTKPAPKAASAANAPAPAAVSTPNGAAVAALTVPTKWRVANKEWLLNAKRGVAFELPSEKRVTIWQGIAQPMLVVRCDAGRLQTFVYTASAIQMEAIDENHTVRVSFDDEAEATERWSDSSDHDALFAPDGSAFALRLLTSRKLRFSYTPHNAPRAVAEFQTSGLDDLIAPAAKQCGWKK